MPNDGWDALGRSLVKKKLGFECCAVCDSPVACATNGYCARPKREYKSEIETVGWAILQALHEGIEDGPQSWSDMTSDQEARIKKTAIAAIEAVTDLSQYKAQGFSLPSHEAGTQEPVEWRRTLSAIKKIALNVKPDGLRDGLASIVRLCIDAGSPPSSKRNWTEDASHENGNYECLCVECDQPFTGHKRRVICKACSNLLTPAAPEAGTQKPVAWQPGRSIESRARDLLEIELNKTPEEPTIAALRAIEAALQGEATVIDALRAVWDDWITANDESGMDEYEIKDVSLETRQQVHKALTGRLYAAPASQDATRDLDFFSENVDRWGAAEWFDRLARAIKEQDAAVVAKDEAAMDICRNVAASSAMRLVRDYEQHVRAALASPARADRAVTADERPKLDSTAMQAAEKHYIDSWRRVLWDGTGDQTKVDRVVSLAEINGLFDPARASLMACGKLAELSAIKDISDDALFNIATEAWSIHADAAWSTDGLDAAVRAVRSAVEDALPLCSITPPKRAK